MSLRSSFADPPGSRLMDDSNDDEETGITPHSSEAPYEEGDDTSDGDIVTMAGTSTVQTKIADNKRVVSSGVSQGTATTQPRPPPPVVAEIPPVAFEFSETVIGESSYVVTASAQRPRPMQHRQQLTSGESLSSSHMTGSWSAQPAIKSHYYSAGKDGPAPLVPTEVLVHDVQPKVPPAAKVSDRDWKKPTANVQKSHLARGQSSPSALGRTKPLVSPLLLHERRQTYRHPRAAVAASRSSRKGDAILSRMQDESVRTEANDYPSLRLIVPTNVTSDRTRPRDLKSPRGQVAALYDDPPSDDNDQVPLTRSIERQSYPRPDIMKGEILILSHMQDVSTVTEAYDYTPSRTVPSSRKTSDRNLRDSSQRHEPPGQVAVAYENLSDDNDDPSRELGLPGVVSREIDGNALPSLVKDQPQYTFIRPKDAMSARRCWLYIVLALVVVAAVVVGSVCGSGDACGGKSSSSSAAVSNANQATDGAPTSTTPAAPVVASLDPMSSSQPVVVKAPSPTRSPTEEGPSPMRPPTEEGPSPMRPATGEATTKPPTRLPTRPPADRLRTRPPSFLTGVSPVFSPTMSGASLPTNAAATPYPTPATFSSLIADGPSAVSSPSPQVVTTEPPWEFPSTTEPPWGFPYPTTQPLWATQNPT